MKSFKIFILLFVLSIPAFASESILNQANEAYQAKDYQAAIKIYTELLQDAHQSADLHYNLGNAYYRANQLGNAVLHYEKAALFSPRDKDILHNLKVVKERLPDQFEVIPAFFISRWWNNTQKLSSSTGWGIIGLLILWAGIAGLIFWLRGSNRKLRKQGFIVGIILILLSIIPFSLGFGAAKMIKDSKRAVVMVAEIKLKSAPDEVSEDILELHEGTSLQIVDEIGTWKKIRLSNGEEGWLETKVLEKI